MVDEHADPEAGRTFNERYSAQSRLNTSPLASVSSTRERIEAIS
jgi:hypothetical protein